MSVELLVVLLLAMGAAVLISAWKLLAAGANRKVANGAVLLALGTIIGAVAVGAALTQSW